MRKKLLSLLQYFATVVLLLVAQRIIFEAISNHDNSTMQDYAAAILHSLPTLLAMAGCITLIPLLLAILPSSLKIPVKKIMLPYNITAAFLMAATFIADIIIYNHTGCRLGYTHLLQFIDTPEKILTSLTIGYLFTRFALTVATTTLFTLLLHKAYGHQI
ncbi:MAG: hypothetical protein IJB77_02040 [Bacteroidaceae bacterium]|nr:hypothetical protein [Bacteroidaceae bacterium]